MGATQEEPGPVEVWEHVARLGVEAISDPSLSEKWYGATADDLLKKRGIVADDASRHRLLTEVHRAVMLAAEQNIRRAGGDYGPDPNAERFPRLSSQPSSPGLAITDLFDLWRRDHLANGKAVALATYAGPLPIDKTEKEPEQLKVVAVEWVPSPSSGAALISEIGELLEQAIPLARSTNLPPERAALTELQRAQLIALLETALAVIKAPLVEKGLLKKVAEAAQSGTVSAVHKQAEFALGIALKKLGEALLKFTGLS